MDMKLAICVMVAFVVVEARFRPEAGCQNYCPYGYVPGGLCECNGRPGGHIPRVCPCDLKECGIYEQCVESRGRAICVPTSPTFQNRPSFGGSSSRVCYQPEDPGHCNAIIRRFFYNSNTQRCEVFIYGGCGGTANNFEFLQDCRNTCELSQDLTWF